MIELRKLIDDFLKHRLRISITLDKFEQLCTTACYAPEGITKDSRSACAKTLEQIKEKLTSVPPPIPSQIVEGLKMLILSALAKIEKRQKIKMREIENEVIRLREENMRLQTLLTNYAGRVLDLEGRLRRCRRRVRELSRKVKSCESTVEGLNSVLELLWRENERLEELAWVWFQEYRIASTERDIYISLVASLSGTIARLLDENEKLWSRVRELENEIARLRSRVNELENSFLGFIATIREIGSELPDKIRRRLLREVGKYLLQ